MSWRVWVLGGALWWGVSAAQAQTVDILDTLQVETDDPVVCLSKRIVFPSTLHLYLGEKEVPPGEYTLDTKSGCVTLFMGRSRLRSHLLTARYRSLDFDLPPSFQRMPDPWVTQTPSLYQDPTTVAKPKPFTPDFQEGLNVTGNQTLGITVGSRRDAKVNQSLDVRIHGKVGANAEILAILSDQDIPFQPEGNTAELEELDKVLVEFKTPRMEAGLGDIDMRNQGPRFLTFNRKAEGVRGQSTWLGATGRISYGSLKGEFNRAEFFGQDGLQGPYSLKGQSAGAVVVAGSETVWLDGARLNRGQDRDYTIEYNRGEIRFTSAHPITAHSRITVDYEISAGSYKRNLMFAGSEKVSLGRGGHLDFAYFSEKDDADRALGGALSNEELAQLQDLGDLVQTVGSGVRYLGPGQGGTYRQIVDSISGKTVFVFVDVGGEYAVDFVAVGEGKGDYASDPVHSSETREIFVHVGDGKGDHIVKRDLPAPKSNQVMDMRWALQGDRGSLRVEGALSSADQNTLSGLDDQDNDGRALWVEGNLEPIVLGKDVSITPRILHRSVDSEFYGPSPYQESFQGWTWNLTETPRGGETVSQVEVETAYGSVLTFHHEVGRLDLADSLEAFRHRHRMNWSDRSAQVRGEWLSVRNTQDGGSVGHLDRGDVDMRWVRWPVQPFLRLLREERETPGAFGATRSRGWAAGLSAPLGGNRLTIETLVGERRDETRPDSTRTWSSSRKERSGSVEVKGILKAVSMALRYEGREIERTGKDVHHLGRIDLRHEAYQGSWKAQTTWDLGTEAIFRGGKSIVADSTGFFDQFGNYVGAGGGYDVRFVENQGEPDLTSSLRMTTRFRWSPKKSENVAGLLRLFSWDGFINLRESSLESRLVPLLSPANYLDPDQVLDGNLRSRQTVDVFPRAEKLGLKIRHELTRRVYRHRAVGGQEGLVEDSRNTEWVLVVRTRPATHWTLELEGTQGKRQESVQPETGAGFQQDTVFRSSGVSAGRRFKSARRSGRISTAVEYSIEEGDGRLAEGWQIEPRLQLTFSKKGRVDVTGGWKHLTARRGFVALFGPGAPLLTPGWELNVRGEIKLWPGVNLSSTFRFDHPDGLDPITEGRFEVRGAF